MTPRRQLETLLGLGFSRRDLAKIMSTSVAGVTLIARGDRPFDSVDVYRISQLDQLHRLVTQVFPRERWGIHTAAAWFEAELMPGCPHSVMDMYVDGKLGLVLELAAELITPEQALDEYDPRWRRSQRRAIELYVGEDGHMTVRPREPGDAA